MPTDVNLGIDLDIKDALKTAEELEKSVERIFKDNRQSPQLLGIQKQLKSNIQTVHELKDTLSDLQSQTYESKFADSIAREEKKIDSYTAKIAEIEAKQDTYREKFVPTDRTKELERELAELDKQYTKLSGRRKELVELIPPSADREIEEYKQKIEELEAKRNEIFSNTKMVEAYDRVTREGASSSRFEAFQQSDWYKQMHDVNASLDDYKAKLFQAQQENLRLEPVNEETKRQLDEVNAQLTELENKANQIRETALPESMIPANETAQFQKLAEQRNNYMQKAEESTERVSQLREKDAASAQKWAEENEKAQDKVTQGLDKVNDSTKQLEVRYEQLGRSTSQVGNQIQSGLVNSLKQSMSLSSNLFTRFNEDKGRRFY